MFHERARRLLAAAALAACAFTAMPLGPSPMATADGPPAPVAKWGPDGAVATDSGTTVRWDNGGGMLAENKVPRNPETPLPHTDGKVYGDIDRAFPAFQVKGDPSPTPSLMSQIHERLDGLNVELNQSKGLLNQFVTLRFRNLKTPVRVLQCWGERAGGGSLKDPEPSHCGWFLEKDSSRPQEIYTDLFARNSDYGMEMSEPNWVRDYSPGWTDRYDPYTGAPYILDEFGVNKRLAVKQPKAVPYESPDGTVWTRKEVNHLGDGATKFVPQTSKTVVDTSSDMLFRFELATTMEEPRLGCGYQQPVQGQKQSTVKDCWLVILPDPGSFSNHFAPMDDGWIPGESATGELGPLWWAQRMQIHLEFRDMPRRCDGHGESLQAYGSFSASAATASWLPQMCDEGMPFAHSTLKDPRARRSQVANPSDKPIIFTTEASPGATHVPIANVAAVLGYNMYLTESGDEFDAAGHKLGKPVRRNLPLPYLRLNARIVAKLLTESYSKSFFSGGQSFGLTKPAMFTSDMPSTLENDDEFRRLNQEWFAEIEEKTAEGHTLKLRRSTGFGVSRLLLESAPSDQSRAVWKWIFADPDARSFLGGCPVQSVIDPNKPGEVRPGFINPFFSLRTMEGCEDQKQKYLTREEKLRKASMLDDYRDQPPDYWQEASAYPQMPWGQLRGNSVVAGHYEPDPRDHGAPSYTAYTRLETPFDVGRATGRMWSHGDPIYCILRDKVGGAFNAVNDNNECAGVIPLSDRDNPSIMTEWFNAKIGPQISEAGSLGITDTVTAARYAVGTALLCKGEDTAHCVGADPTTLESAASQMKASGEMPSLPQQNVNAVGNAYPITVPIYAAVRMSGKDPLSHQEKETLSAAQRMQLSAILTYMTTKGQVSGTQIGQLPLGYSPLTGSQRQAAASAIKAIVTGPQLSTPSASPKEKKSPGPGPAPEAPAAEGNAGAPQRPADGRPSSRATHPRSLRPSSGATPAGKSKRSSGAPPSKAAPPRTSTSPLPAKQPGKVGRTPSTPAPLWAKGLLALLAVGALAGVLAPILENSDKNEEDR